MDELYLGFFEVTIDATGLGGSAPADGFIDNLDPRGWSGVSSWPTTPTSALAKTRAWIRWRGMVQELSLMVNPVNFVAITKPGATQDNPATSLTFTVVYDKVDFLHTSDEINGGILSGVDCIKRLIARALIRNYHVRCSIYDPTFIKGYEEQIEDVDADQLTSTIQLAEANITVVHVPNT